MSIRDIIEKSKLVVLDDGTKVRLQVPSMQDAVEIRGMTSAIDPDNVGMAFFLELTVRSVQACLPGENLSEEEAYQVVASTGGETGKLSVAARKLAGIPDAKIEGDDGPADDLPT